MNPRFEPLIKTKKGQTIFPKTVRQDELVHTITDNQITVCHGPAGTGKTFITTIMAVRALVMGEVDKIVVTRPAVPAGEDLGFLPGDVENKMDPFLRPIYDILELIYPKEKKKEKKQDNWERGNSKANKRGKRNRSRSPKVPETHSKQDQKSEADEWSNRVEVVPFAYMRGRTFHDSFIIADEMQNVTREQLRMIMTRIGSNSKMVIGGESC
jgi:phosphate starvation-inducible PhoH-like protein